MVFLHKISCVMQPSNSHSAVCHARRSSDGRSVDQFHIDKNNVTEVPVEGLFPPLYHRGRALTQWDSSFPTCAAFPAALAGYSSAPVQKGSVGVFWFVADDAAAARGRSEAQTHNTNICRSLLAPMRQLDL